jgi:hypothetical protein
MLVAAAGIGQLTLSSDAAADEGAVSNTSTAAMLFMLNDTFGFGPVIEEVFVGESWAIVRCTGYGGRLSVAHPRVHAWLGGGIAKCTYDMDPPSRSISADLSTYYFGAGADVRMGGGFLASFAATAYSDEAFSLTYYAPSVGWEFAPGITLNAYLSFLGTTDTKAIGGTIGADGNGYGLSLVIRQRM